MIITGLCQSYLQEMLRGVHREGDVFAIALYTAAATLSKTTATYAPQDEVVGEGYVAGGQILEGFHIGRDGAVTFLDWKKDPSWPAATITARGALIYNRTRGNRSVAVWDFGHDVASTNDVFTVALPPAIAEKALIRIRAAG